jgi:hypothetical protein
MSSLQNKMYNYGQTPPEKVWDKIAAALDESHIADEFPSKLYNSESIPPATVWEKIVQSLEAEHLVAVPMLRRRFPLLRYAAAAIIIGIGIFGVIKWTGKNNNSSGNGDITISKNPDTAGKKENAVTDENKTAGNNKDKEYIIPEDDKNSIVKTEQVKTIPEKKVKKNYSVQDTDYDTEPIYAYNELSPARIADRYIMLMTPNGIVRMSKKLGDLVCCVSGQEQDEDCKDQLKKWQEKIACSPVAPSPGNFMDILSLVSSLNDNDL